MSSTAQQRYDDEMRPYWKAEKRAKRAVALFEMREGGPADKVPQPLDGKRKRKGKLIDLMGLGPTEDEARTSESAMAKKRLFSPCESAVHQAMERAGWDFNTRATGQGSGIMWMMSLVAVELCPFLDRFERSWATYEIALEQHQKIRKQGWASMRRLNESRAGAEHAR